MRKYFITTINDVINDIEVENIKWETNSPSVFWTIPEKFHAIKFEDYDSYLCNLQEPIWDYNLKLQVEKEKLKRERNELRYKELYDTTLKNHIVENKRHIELLKKLKEAIENYSWQNLEQITPLYLPKKEDIYPMAK